MIKNFFPSAFLILAIGIMINVQAKEDSTQSFIDDYIVQLKKTCHYEDNALQVDNKNIQVLKIHSDIFNNIYTYDKYESNNKNEIIFNNVKFKDKDKIKFINIRLYNSKKDAIEALFANLAHYQLLCSHRTQVRLLEKDNGFEYGDYAVCVDDRALSFSRANACFYIYCPKGSIDNGYHELFKSLDELCCKQIQTESVDNNRLAIIVSSQHDNLNSETSIETQEPKTTYKRKNGDDEKLEQELKSMPKEDAWKHCLEKALALSESPDDKPEELMLYLRGLPMPEADGTAKILHRIGANSKDAKLLSAAAQMQGKWLSTFSETQQGFIGDLANALKSDDGALRRRAIESLGRSGSLDALPVLLKELESNPGDPDVAAAVGKVLGQKPSGGAMDEGRGKELNNAAADFLRSLETLRKFYDAQ